MRKPGMIVGICLLLCLAVAASFAVVRRRGGQKPPPPLLQASEIRLDPDAVGVRILLGRGDTQPTAWDGSLSVTNGALVHLEGWRFRQADQLTGPSAWKASSRAAQARGAQRQQRRQQRQQQRQGQAGAGTMAPNGVIAFLHSTPQTEVQVTTAHGEFHFKPAELSLTRPAIFLNGAASVERVPADYQLTGARTEDDFPAAAAGPAEGNQWTLWTAYVAYRYGQPEMPYTHPFQTPPDSFDSLRPSGNGDQVRLGRLSGGGEGEATFSDVAALTDPGQDVYRPAIAVDREGNPWVVWSQNVNGNWDLYARTYHNGALSDTIRVTTDPGPDLSPALASDGQGNIWLAWQGFRQGSADIFLSSLENGRDRWSRPMRVSESPWNDWDPQVAAAPNGDIYVAWDTYDRGDYDVMMRRLSGGRLADLIPVASTDQFEARPSLAVDSQDRVWVAWEESPPRWGKDFGWWVQDQGIPLYRGHTATIRCFVDGKPYHTTGDLGAALPSPNPRRARAGQAAGGQQLGQAARQGAPFEASFPRLGTDKNGQVFLTYRRAVPQMQSPTGTAWYSYVTSYDGATWTPPIMVPDSDGLLDGRPVLVSAGNKLFMVHSSDGRGHAFQTQPRYQIYIAPIPLDTTATTGSSPTAGLAADEARPPARAETLASSEREDIARVRGFRIRVKGRTLQPLRGDFHRHTEISPDGGGDGPLIDMFRYAIDAAGQDWICAGDHDYGSGREYTWWQIQKLDDAFHLGSQFVPIFGYERSVRYPDGHRNVMFVQRGIRALPRLAGNQPNGVNRQDTQMLYRYLRAFDGICASHTSATDMGTDWRDNDPKLEPFVEIYQGDRQNYEYQGAPRSGSAGASPGGFEPAGYVWNALGKGYRLGFQASSDHISTHISYAVAYAEAPTRQAIMDAFKQRHCYGATDNIILDVRDGDQMMGDEFQTREAPRLQIHAIGTHSIARVIIVKDNKVVFTATPGKAEAQLNWMDNDAKPGVSYYYVRIEQEDGQLAWASPMWIHYQA